MKPIHFAILLLALPISGNAQDTSTLERGFSEAFAQVFPNGTADPAQTMGQGLALIPHIAGAWGAADQMFPDGTFDAALWPRYCAASGVIIAPTSAASFTMTQLSRGASTGNVVTYSLVAASTFTRTANLDGLAQQLFGVGDLREVSPNMLGAMISAPMLHGYAILRMPNPETLVIENVAARPALFLRCP
ncbi:hypothetical protein [Pararhodobacter sp.]|uniref:hypothetical protein n=1 Tax=Pararhodobacter sp. TaxID=2127056 RepID=UPI002AFEA0F3|nr:hypothetical protein [Pararhodobacter sp.]